ncbi:hypothetical protein EI77_03618 [Prosthecobacter fusiformis]|uniref:Uncharacterized protein n=1 Tax=Prosthecobacter fusiformis TaxID=48464 RepID=A0A4V6Q597_9BACT|nr:hypothetical protein [Prosthecobacter fusiformis]TDU66523.1 hypothetical protein EI77_03618 [Prosthecobacter fusiformis]
MMSPAVGGLAVVSPFRAAMRAQVCLHRLFQADLDLMGGAAVVQG